MVSASDCCQVTAGSGVMSQGCSIIHWTASSFPPAVGNGKVTGMWMKILRENLQRKRWVTTHFLLLFSILDLFLHSCLQGWSYAVDFPATYYKDKKWNSCVRRRRWIRYRRYKAMDIWAKVCGIRVCTLCVLSVPPIHPCFSPSVSQQIPSQHVTLPDPFSDISCGGWEISEEPRGRLSLWAVSLQGKVYEHLHTSTVYIQPVHHMTFVCLFFGGVFANDLDVRIFAHIISLPVLSHWVMKLSDYFFFCCWRTLLFCFQWMI